MVRGCFTLWGGPVLTAAYLSRYLALQCSRLQLGHEREHQAVILGAVGERWHHAPGTTGRRAWSVSR